MPLSAQQSIKVWLSCPIGKGATGDRPLCQGSTGQLVVVLLQHLVDHTAKPRQQNL
jgi:hypothetical protein